MNIGDPKTLAMIVVLGIAGIALLFAMLRTPVAAMYLIVMMVMTSALATQDSGADWTNNTWLRPLQLLRAELYLLSGVLMLTTVLIHIGKMQYKHLPLQGVLLLGMNFFAGMLEMFHRTPLEGLQRLVFSAVTIGPLLVILPSLLDMDGRNFMRMFRAVGGAGALWAGATMIQVVLDRSQLTLATTNRFTGLLGNPQGTAVFLGPMCSILAWLVLNETNRRLRLVWMAAAGFMALCLIWTGSRTGVLMFAFGLTGVLYSRAGKAIFLLPLVGGAVVGLLQLFSAMGIDLGYGLDRLASGTDTRTEIWLIMLEDAVNAPLLGSGDDRKGGVENAFLLGWVIYGPMMLLLMMLMVAASGFVCLKLMSVRSKLEPTEKRMADFIIAFNAMYFAGAFFEWFIVARVDSTILLMCMTSAMAGRLIRIGKERALGVWGTTEEVLYDEYGDDAVTPAAG